MAVRHDTTTISHVDNDLDWVDTPIPVPTPVFQTPSITDCNPINNQLAEALQQLSENLNRGLAPKPYQLKVHILDTFDGSDPHKLNHFLFQCWLFFHANPLQFSTNEEKINFAMTYLSGVMPDSHLGNKRDIFYLNNKNNQLERRVQPPSDVS